MAPLIATKRVTTTRIKQRQVYVGVELLIHARGAAHMIDPQRLVAGTIGVYGKEKFERLYGRIEPIAEQRVVVADDLAKFSLGNRELVFFDTPGHARHHFCIYDELSEGVFTGDTFGISYTSMKELPRGLIPTTPPNQFDPPELRRSVARIMEFEPRRLYLTHYGEFENPGAQVDSFNRWIDQYVDISHRYDSESVELERELEDDLTHSILDALCDAENGPELQRILRNDINLDAQGLAHWRRNNAHG